MSVPLEVIPLGVGSALPTRERHLPATVLRREGRLLLFDCGEGAQHQIVRGGLARSHLEAIFITHLHGDHLFGLPGLLTTLALIGREEPLPLVAPQGIGDFLRATPGARPTELPFALHLTELDAAAVPADASQVVHRSGAGVVTAAPLSHRAPCVGFRFAEHARPGALDAERARKMGVTQGPDLGRLKAGEDVRLPDGRTVRSADVVGPEQPGRAVAYVLDTEPCEGGRTLSAKADLVIHEATFTDEHRERAEEVGHSTAAQAAEIARDAGARHLVLTHFSARYDDPAPLVEEARAIFPNTDAAEELRRYPVESAPVLTASDSLTAVS